MKMSGKEKSATTQALLAFASLTRKEEQQFISTMNVLLQASPKRRREIIDRIREEASTGTEMRAASSAHGNAAE
ncbi:hypothetical protein [Paraburkholderia sp.]|jgi:hypothetical protein|uniref:hypothetical protein n=1 Tax=Paraburkholderia sp. TaxID=1926495 RepID=UPI002F3F43A6